MRFFDPLLRFIRALFIIPRCIVCDEIIGSHEQRFCDDCRKRYNTEKYKSCTRCGYPHHDCKCGVMVGGTYYPIYHSVPYDPRNSGAVSRIVFNAKDEYLRDNFDFIAEECINTLSRHQRPRGEWIMTWIPRRRSAVRDIGHDQSRELAKRLAKHFGCKTESLLVNRGKEPQKSQVFKSRLKNAFGSYRLKKRAYTVLRGKTVVLVDDLTTTGATQHVCIELMKKAGANMIIPLVYAKTDSGFRRYKIRRGL